MQLCKANVHVQWDGNPHNCTYGLLDLIFTSYDALKGSLGIFKQLSIMIIVGESQFPANRDQNYNKELTHRVNENNLLVTKQHNNNVFATSIGYC